MVVAPVLFVCELLKFEHEILMLADNVVGLLEIDAEFPVKYFHVAAPTSQQIMNLIQSFSFHFMFLFSKPLPFLPDRLPPRPSPGLPVAVVA